MEIKDIALETTTKLAKQTAEKIGELQSELNELLTLKERLSLNKKYFEEYLPTLKNKLKTLGCNIHSITMHLRIADHFANFTVHLRNDGTFKAIGSMKYRNDGKMTNDEEIEEKLQEVNEFLSNSDFEATFGKSSLADNTVSNKTLTLKERA